MHSTEQEGDHRHTYAEILVRELLQEDHAPNRTEDSFEDKLRRNLGEFRLNFKKLLFLRNYRFKVVDPSPVLSLVDEEGAVVWGKDPVHPLERGDQLLADLYVEEIRTLLAKGSKRAGGSLQKKPRLEVKRPAWVENPSETAKGTEYGGMRGGRGGRGRGCRGGSGG